MFDQPAPPDRPPQDPPHNQPQGPFWKVTDPTDPMSAAICDINRNHARLALACTPHDDECITDVTTRLGARLGLPEFRVIQLVDVGTTFRRFPSLVELAETGAYSIELWRIVAHGLVAVSDAHISAVEADVYTALSPTRPNQAMLGQSTIRQRLKKIVMDHEPLACPLDPAELTSPAGDGTDVAADIRTSEISSLVSTVATVPDVRVEMQRRQRALIDDIAARHGACVAEGRDVTTVIAPEASVRILLTASEQARLRRRSLEVHGATDEASIAATRDQVVRRDRDDSTVSQFTEAADGVTVVDTSDLDFAGSIDAVMSLVDAARGR